MAKLEGGAVDVSVSKRTLAGLDESLDIGYGGRRSHLQGERPPCAATACSATGKPNGRESSRGMRRLTRPDENLHGAPWPVLSKHVAFLAPDEEALPAKPAA